VRQDLGRFLEGIPSDEQFREWVTRLRAAGLLTENRLQLTEVGRGQALAFLSASELPPRCTWGTIQARYLLPLALGLDPGADVARQIGKADVLASLLLRRRFNLPVGTGTSLAGALEALACRELGFPDETTLKGVRDAVLSRLLGADERLPLEKIGKIAPRVLLGAQGAGAAALRSVALRQWAAGERPSGALPEGEPSCPPRTPSTPEEFDLAAFAGTVLAVARHCPTGRFGDNKVFINHVWRRLTEEPPFADLGLDAFKQKLVEANRADLITLSRADLVSVMDPGDLRESETHYLNAVFHFIRTDKEQS
jgi:hypothetical protein